MYYSSVEIWREYHGCMSFHNFASKFFPFYNIHIFTVSIYFWLSFAQWHLMFTFSSSMVIFVRKQVLSTQNTLVHIMAPISCSVSAMYYSLLVLLNFTWWISAYVLWWHFRCNTDYRKRLWHFKLSKLGQMLYVDDTGFLRPNHIYFKYFQW